jgi:2'-5' RNA ligase
VDCVPAGVDIDLAGCELTLGGETVPDSRKQLSMFVPADAAKDIEHVRKAVDPVQSRLIPAHITLCREDELTDLPVVESRLANIAFRPLILRFGRPEIFSGHGLLLNCIAGAEGFRSLREYLLGSKNIREQKPHITLAHPRNPKAVGNSLDFAMQLPELIEITFPTIYLIEQETGGPWRVLERFTLAA